MENLMKTTTIMDDDNSKQTISSFQTFNFENSTIQIQIENNEEIINENKTKVDHDIRNESLANIEILVLSIILCLAILGNTFMLIALRRQLKIRPMSRMYFFMFHLSVADIFVAFGNILPQLAWDITYRFIGNDILCRIIKYLQVFVLYLSTYILTCMAVDRYLVVCHHSFSRTHYNIHGSKLFIIFSWIVSFIFAIPQVFIFSMTEVKEKVFDCWAAFIQPWGEKMYVVWFVVSAFILPLLIIGASYGAICCRVVNFSIPQVKVERPKIYKRNRKMMKYSFSSSSDKQTESEVIRNSSSEKGLGDKRTLKHQISEAKIKSVKLTLVIILCFIICWAPFCITQLVMVFSPPMPHETVGPIKVILLLLASLNSCTNPWIYLVFSESLFNQLRIILGFGLGRGTNDASIGDEQAENSVPRRVCKIIIEPKEQVIAQSLKDCPQVSIEEEPRIQIHIETKSEEI